MRNIPFIGEVNPNQGDNYESEFEYQNEEVGIAASFVNFEENFTFDEDITLYEKYLGKLYEIEPKIKEALKISFQNNGAVKEYLTSEIERLDSEDIEGIENWDNYDKNTDLINNLLNNFFLTRVELYSAESIYQETFLIFQYTFTTYYTGNVVVINIERDGTISIVHNGGEREYGLSKIDI